MTPERTGPSVDLERLLSDTEHELIRLIAADLPRAQVARQLGMTRRDVDRLLWRIYAKIDVAGCLGVLFRNPALGH